MVINASGIHVSSAAVSRRIPSELYILRPRVTINIWQRHPWVHHHARWGRPTHGPCKKHWICSHGSGHARWHGWRQPRRGRWASRHSSSHGCSLCRRHRACSKCSHHIWWNVWKWWKASMPWRHPEHGPWSGARGSSRTPRGHLVMRGHRRYPWRWETSRKPLRRWPHVPWWPLAHAGSVLEAARARRRNTIGPRRDHMGPLVGQVGSLLLHTRC
mmetsp:Transcript_13938/g.39468  ORF Transcript_13938/g.39468 Transcript_13938/m.39468 type:complete len:215 (-) Transcript_13938:1963-2607(-)